MEFISEHPEVAFLIIGVMVALLGFFFRSEHKDLRDTMDSVERVKSNYLDRFEALHADNNEKHIELLGVINPLAVDLSSIRAEMSMIKEDVSKQKDYCASVQLNKK